MIFITDLTRTFGFPENPIGLLKGILDRPIKSSRQRRTRLVALEMIVRDPDFRVHPAAWREYVRENPIPPHVLPESSPAPDGWPVPVYLERAGRGGVIHVRFEEGGVEERGHRLDLSGPMEAFLQHCSEVGEEAFPDSHRFPFAARVRPGIRLDGLSWELSCLIGYFSTHSGRPLEPVFATGSIEEDGSLKPGEMLEQKIEGWLREVGPGTRAVLLPGQKEPLARFRDRFSDIIAIEDLAGLLDFFREEGWLAPHQREPDNVRCERLLRVSQEWYQRNRPNMALLTLKALERHRGLLSPRQEVLWLGAMHFMLSCFGRFNEGLDYLGKMRERLGRWPGLLSRDEEAIHLAKAAVQLYDAHRFREAEELLRPVVDPNTGQASTSRVCRAKVLGTLGQVLTARNYFEEARALLREAVEIFETEDPLEVSRAYHYLIHNRLRARDTDEAERLLGIAQDWLEATDTYGALFRKFYETELCRLRRSPCEPPSLPQQYSGLIHPYCFALQAWARNECHSLNERIDALRKAADKLDHTPTGKGGVLQFLVLAYRLYAASLEGDPSSLEDGWAKWIEWVGSTGGQGFEDYYGDFLLEGLPDHSMVEALMDRIPYH